MCTYIHTPGIRISTELICTNYNYNGVNNNNNEKDKTKIGQEYNYKQIYTHNNKQSLFIIRQC